MIEVATSIAIALIGLAGVVWSAKIKSQSDNRAIEQNRQDHLEARLEALEQRVDHEITLRRAAEKSGHKLALALDTAITYIETVTAWIDSGARPPAPQSPDITGLREALEQRP